MEGNVVICSNCSAENPVGRRFCDNCGRSLSSACPNCGQLNRPDARFCGNCGTRLMAGPATAAAASADSAAKLAERRLVSVLFADLVGFTPFAEERDPELVRDLLERYFDTARTVVERHGGMVEKFIGDAVMAVWGTPTAHEDDAERAVRAALELLPAVRAMDERLTARAAVLTGEAAINVGAAGQAMVAGDLVNTAARLQSAAPAGTVLVGESTMRAASPAIAFDPAGEQELKGKAAPIPAWRALRVVGGRDGHGTPDTLDPPFVGRDAEIALLKDLLHATTRERRARLVAVTGPAGIGKSRLALELQKYLDGLVEGIYWHRGRSPSYGEGISYWALGEMVRRRCGLAEDDDESTTRGRVTTTVAEYVPVDEDRRWVEPALLALLGVEDAPAGGRDVLFAAWRIFFERIAERGTTVLLFEDLQFADSGLLDFIDHVLEWSKGVPILVLALARPELVERRPAFGSATRNFHSVPLEPLSAVHMRELLAGLVPGLPDDAMRAIVDRAGGIPLYAVETVRMLIADGRLEIDENGRCRPAGPLDRLAVPDTLRSLIASRLDVLEPEARTVVQQAAVLGQTFTLEGLAAVSGRSADELAPILRALVRRELLTIQADPRSPERGQYAFVQGLIREVAYGTLGRRERRERHLAAARYLETLGDEEVAGALASHYVQAYHTSEPGSEADAVAGQARLALRGAAERAAALGAYDQALAHLQQALEVTPEAADRAELLERAADAADAAARHADAERLAREAVATYEQLGDRLLSARASGALGSILVNAFHMFEAIGVFTRALTELGESAPELRAELEARLARAYMRSGQPESAIAAAERSLPIAEAKGMTSVVAEALVNKGTALNLVGRMHEAIALLEAAARLAERLGEREIQLRAMNNLSTALYGTDPPAAGRQLREGLALASRLGQRAYVNFLAPNVALHSVFFAEDWDAVLELLDQTYEAAPNDVGRGRQLLARLEIMVPRGDPAAAEVFTKVEELLAGTDDPSVRSWVEDLRGLDALLGGQLQLARDHATKAVELEPTLPPAMAFFIRVALWLGTDEAVRRAHQRAVEFRRTGPLPDILRVHAAAALAAVEGRRAEAVAGLQRSIAGYFELGAQMGGATSTIDALMVVPGAPELVALADRARGVFERVGARRYLYWLERALETGRSPVDDARPATVTAAGDGAMADMRQA